MQDRENCIEGRGAEDRIGAGGDEIFAAFRRRVGERNVALVTDALGVASDAATVIAPDRTILWQNERAVAMFGPAVGGKCHAVYCGHDSPCAACVIPTILKDGQTRDAEHPCTQGSTTLAVRAVPVKDPHDQVAAVVFISRERGAERLLRESDRLFRTLIDTMSDGLGMQTHDGTIVYVNKRFAEMLGYAPGEMIGRHTGEFVAPDEREFFLRQVERHRRDPATSAPYELTWLHRNGSRVLTRMAPQQIDDGAAPIQGSFAVITDITEHKMADDALLRSEALFRGIIENANDVFYRRNLKTGRYEYFSPSLEAILGYSPEEAMASSPDDAGEITHPEDRPRLGPHLEKMLSREYPGGIAPAIEYRLRDCDGKYHWVSDCSAIVWDHDGEALAEVGAIRDVTEQKQAEEAVRASENRFRAILENSLDIAYKLDLVTQTYEYLSPSVERVTGYTADELCAPGYAHIVELVHPEDRETFRAHFHALVSGAVGLGPASTIEYRLMTKWGDYQWLSDSTTLLRDESGMPAAIVGVARDITERRKTEEALRAASRLEATATLAGGVAHEFNNLMVSVLGNAELIEYAHTSDPKAKRLLREIIVSAQKAGELAHQLLAFARGGMGQPALLNLNERITQVLALEKHAFPHGIELASRLAPNLWPIRADARQIDHIIMDLTINAVEAIHGPGRVTVATANLELAMEDNLQTPPIAPGRYVHLSIEDTGRGMSSETVARIFEPFYTTKVQGRGLGLSSAYGIVSTHGGTIRVASTVGRGSTFEVYLPAADPGSRQLAPEIPRGAETILIIDDEEMVLNVTQKLLERLGYAVHRATDGAKASSLAREAAGTVHVALLDINMPGQSTEDTLRQLRSICPGIRVIICSGYDMSDRARALTEAGAHGFLHKPFKVADLSNEIRRVLDL